MEKPSQKTKPPIKERSKKRKRDHTPPPPINYDDPHSYLKHYTI